MELGFSSLLDKFENYYGRKASRALVGLIALAIVSVCVGLIWSFVNPIYLWAYGAVEQRSWTASILSGGGFILALLIIGSAGSAAADAFAMKSLVVKASQILERAAEEMDRTSRTAADMAHIIELADRLTPEDLAKLKAAKFGFVAESTKKSAEHIREMRALIGDAGKEGP